MLIYQCKIYSNFPNFLSTAMALIGEPDAPDNFKGVIINVKYWSCSFSKLHRFSTTNT